MSVPRTSAIAVLVLSSCLVADAASAYTLKTTTTGSQVRWHQGSVDIRLTPGLAALGSRRRVSDATTIAVEAWRGLPGAPTVRVAEGRPGRAGYDPTADGPDNGIYVVNDWRFEEGLLAVTVATFDDVSGQMVDADIIVNGNQSFAFLSERDEAGAWGDVDEPDDDGRRAYDVAAVLTHELGHFLGLGESHDDENATMWPRIGRHEVHQRTIEVDDEQGVVAVYQGLEVGVPGGCGGATVAGGVHPTVLSTIWMLFTAAMGLLYWRHRQRRGVLARGTGRSIGRPYVGLALGAMLFAAPIAWTSPAPADYRAPAGHALWAQASSGIGVAVTDLVGASEGRGRCEPADVRLRDGIMWTRCHFSAHGVDHSFEVAGGSMAGLTQVVGESGLPPTLTPLDVSVEVGGRVRWEVVGDETLASLAPVLP